MIRVAMGTGNISQAYTETYVTFPDRCKISALLDYGHLPPVVYETPTG